MDKVFIISTAAEYHWDAYEILAVYDNEDEAKRVAGMITNSYCHALNVNEFKHDEPPVGMGYFQLEMKKDGKIVKCWPPDDKCLDEEGKRWDACYSLEAQQKHPYERGMWRLSVSAYVKYKKDIIKIANDIRKQLLADPNKPRKGPL